MSSDQLILSVALTRRIRMAASIAGKDVEAWLQQAVEDRTRTEQWMRAPVQRKKP